MPTLYTPVGRVVDALASLFTEQRRTWHANQYVAIAMVRMPPLLLLLLLTSQGP